MAEDNVLGVRIQTSGAETLRAQIAQAEQALRGLQRQLAEATASAARFGDAGSGVTRLLQQEISTLAQSTNALRARLAEESRAEVQALRTAAATREANRELEFNAGLILKARRALDTAPVERGMGRFMSTAGLIQAQQAVAQMEAAQARVAARTEASGVAMAMRAQRGLETAAPERTVGRFMSSAEIVRAGRGVESLRDSIEQAERAAARLASPGHFMSSAEIIRAQRAVERMKDSLNEAAGNSRVFVNELRHGVAAFDELARGQRGALFGTLGAAVRDSGAGIGVLVGGVGVLAAVMAGTAIMRGAENMGKWAEQVRAASAATGMSITQYSQLQGALVLTGVKATNADASLRQFAKSLEEAAANPASRAAKAFHAMGISQEELVSQGSNTMAMFQRYATAWNSFQNDANRAAAGAAVFGRNIEEIAPLLERSQNGINALMNEAKRLGITLTPETSEKLVQTENKITTLSETIHGQAVKAFIEWAPTIGVVVDKLTGLVNIAGQAGSAVAGLANRISEAVSAAGTLGALTFAASPLLSSLAILSSPKPGAGPHNEGMVLGRSWGDWSKVSGFGRAAEEEAAKPRVQPFDIPKGSGNAAHKEFAATLAEEKTALEDLKRQHQLYNEQQDANFQKTRLQARVQLGDREIDPLHKAMEEYNAYKSATEAKIAELSSFQARSDAMYDRIIAEAAKVYDTDAAQYKRAVGEKIAADREYEVQAQRFRNEELQHAVQLVEAHKQAVDKVVSEWGSTFDRMGDQIESTIGEAIKSAFIPMKPEYWWSSTTGPKGQPMMEAHRINPAMQLIGNLGTSLLGDLGKQLGSSITSSIAKSIFGAGTQSMGQGLASLIGIGGPGGLFGTGLGAVAKVGTDAAAGAASSAPVVTAITASTTGIVTGISTAIATSTGTITTALQEVVAAVTAVFAKPSVLGTTFASGGIVPAAAGGWSVPRSFGTDTVPAMLTPGETVLPESERPSSIAKSLSSQIDDAGDIHMHFHGPADGPSIAKWFAQNMRQNSSQIRDMFRSSALTPRSF